MFWGNVVKCASMEFEILTSQGVGDSLLLDILGEETRQQSVWDDLIWIPSSE